MDEMNENEALEIISDYCMDMEYYFAEHDCYPKHYSDDFHTALTIAIKVLNERNK